MNEELGGYYEFDAADGCDLCQSMAGIYEEEPSRPHPNCDCEIILTFFDFDDAELEYTNAVEDSYPAGTEVGSSDEYTNPFSSELDFDVRVSTTEDPEVDLPTEIIQFFDVSEAVAPLEIDFSIPITLEPRETVSVDIEVYYKTFFYAVDCVISVGGLEISRETITGQTRTPVEYTKSLNRY